MTLLSTRGALCAASLALALAPQLAHAQSRIVTNPRKIAIQRVSQAPQAAPRAAPRTDKNGHPLLGAAPLALTATPSVGGEKRLDLDVVYTDNQIYNPNTGVYDKVHLRSYTGTDVDPAAPFVAPTIEVVPGDTVRMTLHNMLPADDPSCPKNVVDMDIPHCFNSTNMHSHGLWVSPSGNSDNVLIDIKPTVSFQYEYNIPSDHPAGTFWYHPHEHGSTALQVASGMAGALIIRGNRLPTPTMHGDIDTLLHNANGAPMTERVLVLQQVQYACLDKNGQVKVQYQKDANGNYVKNSSGNYIVIAWVCDPGDTGKIESYEDTTPSASPYAGPYGFGPGNWAASARFTSINGLVLPTFKATAGDVERWRMIHAGIRDTISLQFYKMKQGAPSTDHLLAANESQFISANCTGDPIPYHLIAQDGLTMGQAQKTTVTTLQPGYRADALVVFPQAGNYCVVNAQVAASASVSRVTVTPRLLGVVMAAGLANITDIDAYLTKQLVQAAARTMPAPVNKTVTADLEHGLLLTSFTPHPDIAASELSPTKQYLTFFIDTTGKTTKFEVSTDPFDVPFNPNTPFNPKPYDPNRIDRHLVLGTVQEWDMQSRFASHPYHIHVNPFQIVAVLDPNGKDVSGPDAVDDFGGTVDPQYRGMKGVWKDTIWIKNVGNVGTGAYTVIARTRYQRYIGEFVLHCHILDHEDQGMMENVAVELPGQMDDGMGGMH